MFEQRTHLATKSMLCKEKNWEKINSGVCGLPFTNGYDLINSHILSSRLYLSSG